MEPSTSGIEPPPLLLAEGLHFAYPPWPPGAAVRWVIDGLDLRVAPGEWLAVMGASDAGKTTLCLVLAGLAPHLTGGTMEGRVAVVGHDTREHPPPALAGTVGLLFQEPEAQLFNPTVEAELAWGLENLGLPVPEIEARVGRDEAARVVLEEWLARAFGEEEGSGKGLIAGPLAILRLSNNGGTTVRIDAYCTLMFR